MLGMFEARHSSRMLCWLCTVEPSSSSSSTPRWPTLVGGSCSGSPTTITWLPRAMAPIASQTGICEASSKITTSNGLASAGRYCAIDSGLIITQGASWVRTFGIRPNSWRSGMCRAFLLISRASVPHSGSLPKLVCVGTAAPIRALTICWASSQTFLSAATNASIAASCFSARKPASTSSSLTMVSATQPA